MIYLERPGSLRIRQLNMFSQMPRQFRVESPDTNSAAGIRACWTIGGVVKCRMHYMFRGADERLFREKWYRDRVE